MLQKLRSNQKGFTLIELMIVIAIIGILAAIAVPQFMAYRMRGYHSVTVSDLRNWVAAQSSLFEDGATYGVVDFTQNLNNAVGSGPGAVGTGVLIVAGGRTVPETIEASPNNLPGTMLTGTRINNAGIPINFAFPISVGDGVELTTAVSVVPVAPLYQDSYVMVAEHQKGIRAFGADSDVTSTIFFVENELWSSTPLGQIDSAAVITVTHPNVLADGFTNQNGGGPARNPLWQVMK